MKSTNKKKSMPLLLLVLLLLSPIVWIPIISAYQLKAFKSVILFIFIVQPLFYFLLNYNYRIYNKDFHVLLRWLIIFVLLSSIGLVSAVDLTSASKSYLRYVITIPLFINMYFIFERNPGLINLAFKIMIIPIVISSIFTLLNYYGILSLDLRVQVAAGCPLAGYKIGLSGPQGGQSWAIGYTAPIVCYYLYKSKIKSKKFVWLLILVLLLYCGSILQNRGGFIAATGSSLIVIYLLLSNKGRTLQNSVLILGILMALVFREDLIKYFLFEIRGLEYGGMDYSFENINQISCNRWERWMDVPKIVARYPFSGIGFAPESVPGLSVENTKYFHNFILDNIVYTGIFSTIALFIFFGVAIKTIIRKYNIYRKFRQNDLIIVITGILFSHVFNIIVEYGSMFTAIFTGISFWVALAALCVIPERMVVENSFNRKQKE